MSHFLMFASGASGMYALQTYAERIFDWRWPAFVCVAFGLSGILCP